MVQVLLKRLTQIQFLKGNSPWPSFALSAKVAPDRSCDAQVIWDVAEQIMICRKRSFRSSVHSPLWSEEHSYSHLSCLFTPGLCS